MSLNIAAAIAALKALERECPSCGRRQVVAASKKFETVTCDHCGQPVPPKDKS